MIRHIALFRWKEDTTDDQIAEVTARLRALPGLIDSIRDYRVGRDLGINPDTFDYAVVADFDDPAGYVTYRDHPEHMAVATGVIWPMVTGRASVQFDID